MNPKCLMEATSLQRSRNESSRQKGKARGIESGLREGGREGRNEREGQMDDSHAKETDEQVISQAPESMESLGRPENSVVVEIDWKRKKKGRREEGGA